MNPNRGHPRQARSWLLRLTGLALATAVLLAAYGAAFAHAQPAPTLGAPPSGQNLIATRLGSFTFSTNLLHQAPGTCSDSHGNVISPLPKQCDASVFTVTVHPSGRCAYGCTTGWDFPSVPGAAQISSCQGGRNPSGDGVTIVGDTTCTYLATGPTCGLNTYPPNWPPCDHGGPPGDGGNFNGPCPGCGNFNGWAYTVGELYNVQGTGITENYIAILPNYYAIQGRMLEPNPNGGSPKIAQSAIGKTVTFNTSAGTFTTTVFGDGSYNGLFPSGPVTVTPPLGFSAPNCPGTASGSTCTVNLNKDYTLANGNPVDFEGCGSSATAPSSPGVARAGRPRSPQGAVCKLHKLSGTVTTNDGRPAPSVTVTTLEHPDISAATDQNGNYSMRLPEGDYTVVPQPPGSAYPNLDQPGDCTGLPQVCDIHLDQDRAANFTVRCIIPPGPALPLPADTPDPIPGAVHKAALEAVGCFTYHQNTDTYTSDKPVRLNGIDILPDAGTTITIDSNANVSWNGSGRMYLDRKASLPLPPLSISFATPTIDTNTLGLFKKTGTSPLPFYLPFPVVVGATIATTSGRSTVPFTALFPTNPLSFPFYNFDTGTFEGSGKVGGQISLNYTNRAGLSQSQFCLSVGDLKPWGTEPGVAGLKQGQVCWTPIPGGDPLYDGELSLKAVLDFGPTTRIGATASFVKSSLPGGASPYVYSPLAVSSIGIEYDGADLPITEPPVIYFQRIGGSIQFPAAFFQHFAYGTPLPPFSINAGFSAGPKIVIPSIVNPATTKYSVEALSMDARGTFDLNDPPSIKVTGLERLLAGSLLETPIGAGYFNVFFGNYGLTSLFGNLRAEFGGNGHIGIPGTPLGVNAQINGYFDVHNADFYIDATGPYPAGGQAAFVASTTGAIFCVAPPFISGASYGAEITFSPFHVYPDLARGCNVSSWKRVKANGTAASAASPPGARVRIPRAARAAYLIVRGQSAPPRLRITGPGGFNVVTPASGSGGIGGMNFVMSDASAHRTFVNLARPAAGAYQLSPLPGSSIASVSIAHPVPSPAVRGTVVARGCARTLHYHLRHTRGETVSLFTQSGDGRRPLGSVNGRRAGGKIRFSPANETGGAGTVVAELSRHGIPQEAVQTVARYQAVNALAPAAPTSLRAARRGNRVTISWRPACGAARYSVTVGSGATARTTTVNGTATVLAAPKGPATVSVTSLGATGRGGASASHHLS